jgi:FkbM family methyltransferase
MSFSTKSLIKQVLRKNGIYLFRDSVPRGFCVYSDLRKAGLIDKIKTFIDVGANEGDYAEDGLRSLPRLEKVILIEPEKRNYDRLKTRFRNRAVLVNCAISNSSGSGVLNISSSDKMHSLRNVSAERHSNDASTQSVAVETLSDLVHRLNPPSPYFVKTDTEGHDLLVLEGMQDLFQDVIAIVIEGAFYKNQNITFFQAAHDYMIRKGFLFWGIYDQSPWGIHGSCNVINGMFINSRFLIC